MVTIHHITGIARQGISDHPAAHHNEMKWMCHFGGQAMIIAPSRLCLPSKVWCHILREDCQSKRLYSVVSARPAKSASHSRTMCKIPHICHHCQFGFTSSVLKQICSPRADCRASTASRMWLWVGNQLFLKNHSAQVWTGKFPAVQAERKYECCPWWRFKRGEDLITSTSLLRRLFSRKHIIFV